MAYTTIDDPSAYFHTQLYTGNGSDRTITNDANAGDFKPDWVWVKHRNHPTAHSHNLVDSSRGGTKTIYSSNSGPEETISTGITGFATDGFTVGTNVAVNSDTINYVAWQWKANGGTTSSNTDGSITSTVQANTTAGFSIVTYTGVSGGGTTGHGLGTTPVLSIRKSRTNSLDWFYHTTQIDGGMDYLKLNSTDASSGSGLSAFTSTVIPVDDNTENYVAYVFAEKQGYSKFGTYTGNGSTDGTFVYTGFKPSFIIMKPTNQSTEWTLQDTARDPVNPANKRLIPNSTIAEYTNTSCLTDFVSNGFKMRSNHPSNNSSGYNFLYMAFAEHPFVSSEGVPTTAR